MSETVLASRKVGTALQAFGFAALSACAGTCDCGVGGGFEASSTSTSIEQVTPNAAGAPKLENPPYQSAHAPLKDVEQREKLEEIQTDLRAAVSEPSHEVVTTTAALRAELPDKLDDFVASSDPVDGPSSDDGHPVAIVSRRYRNAQGGELYVKITDTVQSKAAQLPLIEALTLQGHGDWGTEHGALLASQPALVRVYKTGGVSATLLVGKRYMFELKLQRSGSEKDLARIAISLPFKMLGVSSAGTGG